MRASRLVPLAAIPLALTACGAGDYDTITNLKDAVVTEANLDCTNFSQVDPSGYSTAHGSCNAGEVGGFGLDLYGNPDDRDKGIAGFLDAVAVLPDQEPCIAYGDTWSVSFTDDTGGDWCAIIADRLDGQVAVP